MDKCPCGNAKDYASCCEPFILAKEDAKTAEETMRARYSAFAKGQIDYIEKTHHPDYLHQLDMPGIKEWSDQSNWLGLEIKSVAAGGVDDSEGVIEFVAKYQKNGVEQVHHEISDFKKRNNFWYFADGKIQRSTVRRMNPKMGRNDPCPCGSGKKFKKCCLK